MPKVYIFLGLTVAACISILGYKYATSELSFYENLAKEQNPKVAMEHLKTELKNNPDLANSCHGITHEIGHIAFEEYGFKKALSQFEDDLCGSGYMHGVTEEYISQSDKPLADMLTACPKGYGACFHGIGHGLLLYYENDLPKATAGCDQFKEIKEQVQCSEGVFMQNYNTDTKLHKNDYLDPQNTLFPCLEQPEIHKSACYFYSPRYFVSLHPNAYKEAIKACLNAEKEFIPTCIRGVGSVTMKQNIEDIDLNKEVCKYAPSEYQNHCIAGATGYYVIHAGSLAEAEKLCPRLTAEFQTVCRNTVANSKDFFLD